MASDLRKGIALGVAAQYPHLIYSYWNQRSSVLDTNTKWVRFWADWAHLQPEPSYYFDHPRWADLDAQIRQAITDGLYVIVTAYHFPTWTNEARRDRLRMDARHRDAQFVVPDAITPTPRPGADPVHTPWSAWIEHLTKRYNPATPTNGAFAHCIEVMNEPNIQMRPLWENPDDPNPDNWRPEIHRYAAEMMKAAQQVKNGFGGPKDFWPILLGPATGDTMEKLPSRMPYSTFTTNLINQLGGWRAGGWYAWSHHNHRDIEIDGGDGSDYYKGPAANRAQHARSLITNKWWGWGSPDNASNPKMWLTEGGGRLPTIREEWFIKKGRPNPTPQELRDKQAQLLRRNHNRMIANTGDGAGMSMLMQYLVTSSPDYDTGLRDCDVYGEEAEII